MEIHVYVHSLWKVDRKKGNLDKQYMYYGLYICLQSYIASCIWQVVPFCAVVLYTWRTRLRCWGGHPTGPASTSREFQWQCWKWKFVVHTFSFFLCVPGTTLTSTTRVGLQSKQSSTVHGSRGQSLLELRYLPETTLTWSTWRLWWNSWGTCIYMYILLQYM